MPKRRTEKSKYRNVTTGDYCTCAQYIAEILCIRLAEKENAGSLPYRFWDKKVSKKWSWTFLKQKMIADKIIKKYSESAIVRAIQDPSLKSVFSLNHKSVDQIVAKHQKLIDQEIHKPESLEIKESPTFRKSGGGKNLFNKLRDIDGKSKKE